MEGPPATRRQRRYDPERRERTAAAALAGLVDELTVRRREQLVLGCELYMVARRKPFLREAARRWVEELRAPFIP